MIICRSAAAGAIGDILARNLDWPGAEEIEERLKRQIESGGGDPEAAAQMQLLQGQVAQLSQALAVLDADRSVAREKLKVDAFNAETQRMKVVGNTGTGIRGQALNSP